MNILLLVFQLVEFDIYCHDLPKGSVSSSWYHSTTYSVTSGLEVIHSTTTSSFVVKVLTASIIWKAKNLTENVSNSIFIKTAGKKAPHKQTTKNHNSTVASWDCFFRRIQDLVKVKKKRLKTYFIPMFTCMYPKYCKIKHVRSVTMKMGKWGLRRLYLTGFTYTESETSLFLDLNFTVCEILQTVLLPVSQVMQISKYWLISQRQYENSKSSHQGNEWQRSQTEPATCRTKVMEVWVKTQPGKAEGKKDLVKQRQKKCM